MKRTQVLNLGKHFSIIDSPVPFYLIDNYGFRAYRPSGAWQFDNWKLLPEKFHKNYPVYTLSIEWDSGVNDDVFPTFTDTDLDLGDGISGVSGQPVNITTPITVANLPNVYVGKQVSVPVRIVDDFIIPDEPVLFERGKKYFIKTGVLLGNYFSAGSTTGKTNLLCDNMVVYVPLTGLSLFLSGLGRFSSDSSFSVLSGYFNVMNFESVSIQKYSFYKEL